ncbi:MAG: phage tail tape measure protein [Caldilinea sp. CFX5]|nr:phage tail tape measure protein [Caldilinea sp. CFX5]
MAQTVANLLIKFESDTNNAVRGISRVEASLGNVGQRANGVGALLGNFGRVAAGAAVAGVAALGAALTATAVDGTKMAMDLEAQMSGIAAAMQASREEVEPLKELILSLGMNPNLKVSTLEAAAAIDSLVRNGVAMKEIMEGAAEATVLLSNATGGDFAMSADIMTDVMNQFKGSAGSYMDAVNGIVGVTNASKFTIDDYRLAIAQAGGVAASVGVEFGDFNTTIAAISPLFGSGSDAGTSFKTMLQTLIPKSKDAETAMRELGLMTAEGSNRFFDAQGNLKSMADISSILQGALAGLSEEQRNAALSTIFGTDAMRAAVALADSGKVIYTDVALAAKELGVSQEALNGVAADGITAFEALQVQMGQVDALEAAKTRMDNTKGALEILGGVVETVKIQIGDAFLPVVRQLAEQLATFVSENQGRIVAFFGSFAVGVGVAAGYIPTLVQGIFDLAAWLGSLYTALQTTVAGWQPFIDGVLAVVQPVVDAVAGFVSWQDILIVVAGIIGGSVVTTLGGLVAALAPVVGAVLGAVAAVALMRNAWERDWGGVRTAVTGAWEAMQPIVTALRDWLATNVPAALTTLQATWSTAWDALPGAVTAAQEVIGAAWQTLTDLFGPSIERIKGALGEMVAGLAPIAPKFTELQTAISNMVAAVMPVVQTLGGVIAGVLGVGAVLALNWLAAAFEALPDIVGAVIDQVTATVELIATTVSGVTQTIIALFQGDFAGAWEGVKTVVGGVVTYIQQTLGNLGVLVWAAFGIITETLGGTFTDLKGIVSGFGLDVDGAITKLTSLGEWIKKLFTGDVALNFAVPEWMTTLLAWAWPAVGEAAEWVTTLLAWAWPTVGEAVEWVTTLLAWAWPAVGAAEGWVTTLLDWEWPVLGMPDWLNRLFNWSWPSFPQLPSWLGGSDGSDATDTSNGTGAGSVTGSSAGSGRSLLGPVGREPVAVGAGGVQIVINASVASNLDIEELAYRVAAILQRRRG